MKVFKKAALAATALAAIMLVGNVDSVLAKGKSRAAKKPTKVTKVVKRQNSGSMEWRGTVDDRVRVEIRRRNAKATAMSGQSYNDGDSQFWGRLPNQNVRVSVDKLDGRGKVYVVQQPSRRNNYTAVVDIVDNKGGADRYRFRLSW